MRTAFHEQLDALTHSIGDMCGLAGTAMQWFSGLVDVPLPLICDDSGEYLANLKPVETARRIWELDGRKAALMKEGLDQTGKEKREILYAIAEVQRQIDKLRGADGG